jgi:putative ABC transport system permease protein
MMRFLRRLLSLFTSRRDESELSREMDAHLAMLEASNQERGMTPEEARLAARRAMGSIALAKDRHRDARSFVWIDDMRRDIRYAVRQLRRTPGFTAVAVLTLGLGIGVNTAFFTIVNAICLRGLPTSSPERVLTIGSRDAQGRPAGGLSYAEFEALRAAQKSFVGVAAYVSAPVAVADEERAADRVMGAHISATGFGLLGDVPILGRGFHADDDRPGAPPVVVIAASLWKSRYGGDGNIIGKEVVVSGVPATVIGVMPDGFRFLQNTELWQPLETLSGPARQRREVRPLFVFARLASGVSADQARAEMEALSAVWARESPESNRGISARVVPINEQMSANITDPTWLSFITAGALVLLVACANVANLLLMRGAVRGREIAIRTSIGATRARLMRQLLIESTLLAVLGVVTGLVVSIAGLRWLSGMIPAGALQYWMTLTIDGRVLVVLAAVSAVSVLVFGLAPALHLLRVDINQIIKDSGRAADAGRPARRWTTAFLAVEFALTLVLIALVVTGIRQTRATQRAEFSFDASPILSMWVTVSGQPYTTSDARQAFLDRVVASFGAVPGVSSVSVASALPRVGGPAMKLEIAGDSPSAPDRAIPTATVVAVGQLYFETLRVPLARGRAFTAMDAGPGEPAAIVSQRLVDMFFGTRDPIGQLIRVTPPGTTVAGPWTRIVGVSPTVRQTFSGANPDPVVYLPYRSSSSPTAAILVRGDGSPDALAPVLRQALHGLDPHLPLYRVMSLQRAMDEAGWNGRMASVVAQTIAMIALFMALVGLYSVTAHAVLWWCPELGLRIALGARGWNVGWIVLRRVLTQLSIGLVLGLVATLAFDRLFNAPVDQSAARVRMDDAGTLALIACSILAVAVLACVVPIRRAMRVDPLLALRSE